MVMILLWAYALLLGFFAYTAAKLAWHRLKIGVKVIIAPPFLAFWVCDVLFNVVVGSILFLELPGQLTFSARCADHLYSRGWRGRVAQMFATLLNSIYPDHVI